MDSVIPALVLYLLYPKHSNVVFMIKSIKTLTIHGLNIRWAIKRDIAMFESQKKNLDKERKCGGLFVDLSKTFDCLQQDLLLAKLYAYGFDYKSLKLISSFLINRKCITKINLSFSELDHLLIGVPQGSVMGPLLINIYMRDLFVFIAESNVANYADDTTLYTRVKKLSDL